MTLSSTRVGAVQAQAVVLVNLGERQLQQFFYSSSS